MYCTNVKHVPQRPFISLSWINSNVVIPHCKKRHPVRPTYKLERLVTDMYQRARVVYAFPYCYKQIVVMCYGILMGFHKKLILTPLKITRNAS